MATCNKKLKSHYKYGKSWVFRTPHSISFNSLVFSTTFLAQNGEEDDGDETSRGERGGEE